ncbi:MAG: hypothetical protein LBG92_02845 [Prevotellaceae bacterium]|nr:hypothetical protein [Prevotellaceae bacterium]
MRIGSKKVLSVQNFHNRRRAIALSEAQQAVAPPLFVCGYENLAHSC